MNFTQLIDIGSKVSLAVVLMGIIFTGSQGYWVFGSAYKELQNDRDEWKRLALTGTNLAVRTSLHPTGIIGAMAAPPQLIEPLEANADKADVEAKLEEIANAQ